MYSLDLFLEDLPKSSWARVEEPQEAIPSQGLVVESSQETLEATRSRLEAEGAEILSENADADELSHSLLQKESSGGGLVVVVYTRDPSNEHVQFLTKLKDFGDASPLMSSERQRIMSARLIALTTHETWAAMTVSGFVDMFGLVLRNDLNE